MLLLLRLRPGCGCGAVDGSGEIAASATPTPPAAVASVSGSAAAGAGDTAGSEEAAAGAAMKSTDDFVMPSYIKSDGATVICDLVEAATAKKLIVSQRTAAETAGVLDRLEQARLAPNMTYYDTLCPIAAADIATVGARSKHTQLTDFFGGYALIEHSGRVYAQPTLPQHGTSVVFVSFAVHNVFVCFCLGS